jgi:multiple sugar transport system permease protein
MSTSTASLPTYTSPQGRSIKHIISRILLYLAVAAVVFWTLFPLYWAAVCSIRENTDSYSTKAIPWISFQPTLDGWRQMWSLPEIHTALKNSAIIGIGAATLATALGALAGYGIARFYFQRPRNGSLTTWFLSQRIIPPVVFVTPFVLLMFQVGLYDNVWGLVLLNATFNLPFPIIILTQMFREIPIELEEAAQIDGASRFEIFMKIAVPLVAPGIVVSWILCMAFSWNEFLFAFSTTQDKARPMSVMLVGAEQTRGVDYLFVGTRMVTMMSVPIVAALLVQKYIVRGLSLGAVKG